MCNSFFMDGNKSEPAPEPGEMTAHINAFTARTSTEGSGSAGSGSAGPSSAGRLVTYEEVIEIAEYVQGNFVRLSNYAGALQPFWEAAATIAPDLGPADRAEFFAIRWGRHAPMSALYRELAGALALIDHAEDIFVGLDAVTPRETSILDVKTLGGVMQQGGDAIEVCTPNGRRVLLPRARICAADAAGAASDLCHHRPSGFSRCAQPV